MNPIINPMWFYWIDILGSLKLVMWMIAIGIAIAIIVGVPFLLSSYNEYLDWNKRLTEETQQIKLYKNYFKWIRIGFIACLVSLIIAISVPSEKTFYKMMVAKHATIDNVNIVLEKITEGVDYIFDKIEGKGK